MSHVRTGVVAALAAGCCGVSFGQTALHVDASAAAGGDGLGWLSAFVDLQDALDAARDAGGSVEEIRIAAGVYRPAGPGGDRDVSFEMVDGAALFGGFAPGGAERDPETYITVLCGDLNGDDGPDFANRADNARRVVTALGFAAPAVLDGLTVRGGFIDSASMGGAGISVVGAGVVLREVVVRDNLILATSGFSDAHWFGGAGVYAAAEGDDDLEVRIIDAVFEDNVTEATLYAYGGGVFVPIVGRGEVAVSIEGSTFVRNRAVANIFDNLSSIERFDRGARGGAVAIAQFNSDGTPEEPARILIDASRFEENGAINEGRTKGGAVYIAQRYGNQGTLAGRMYVDIRRSAFLRNGALPPQPIELPLALYGGGAIGLRSFAHSNTQHRLHAQIEDCEFTENRCAVPPGNHPGYRGAGAAVLLRGPGITEITGSDFIDNAVVSQTIWIIGQGGSAFVAGAVSTSPTIGGTSGGSLSVADCRFERNLVDIHSLAGPPRPTGRLSGIAVYAAEMPLTISRSTFTENHLRIGEALGGIVAGGVVAAAGPAQTGARLTVYDSTFADNRIDIEGGTADVLLLEGAAINARWAGRTEIVDTTIAGNEISVLLDADVTLMGQISAGGSEAVIRGVTVTGNLAALTPLGEPGRTIESQGAALTVISKIADIDRCMLTGNTLTVHGEGAAVLGGGALGMGAGLAVGTISNTLIADNTAPGVGGIWLEASEIARHFGIVNSTIADNIASGSGIGVDPESTGPLELVIDNAILWGNRAVAQGPLELAQIDAPAGSVLLRRSIVEGWTGTVYTGTVVHGDDPWFVDPDAGDYQLAPGSPAIDAGDNTLVPPGLMTDLAGNPRFMNDPFTETTGVGGSAVVDLGAYEHRPSCDADFAQPYGVLDIFDVLEFLALFEAGDPAADLAPPFGVLDIFDVLEFLAQFEAGCG